MPKVIPAADLFEATISVYAECGYLGATTQEIARRAGVNEVTLFRRFGSKAALISAALTDRLAEAPFARVAATDDVQADLLSLVRAYDQTARLYGGAVMTLLTDVAHHPELRGAIAALLPNLRQAADVIAAHQAAGRLRPGDPLQRLIVLIAPLMMTGLWARTGEAAMTQPLEPEGVVDAFLDGHRAH